MAYCVICGRWHDPDVGCFDGTGQSLRDMGIPRPRSRRAKGSSTGEKKWPVALYLLIGTALVLTLWWIMRAAL